jgi:hypothetical protein
MKLQIRPSAAHRWIECTKSPHIECRLPDTTNVYAAEGIKAHELAARILLEKELITNADPSLMPHIKEYIDYINSKGRKNLLVEHRLEMLPGISGTADCIFTKKNRAYVVDYKHGAGVDVDISNNPQLLLYAIGTLDLFPDCKKVVTVIVQPRTTGIKKAVYSRKEIAKHKSFFLKKLDEIKENPQFKIGEHCKWCKAEATCIARHDQLTGLLGTDLVDTDRFLSVLNQADEIEAFIKAVRGKAFEMLSKGMKVPDWKLVAKRESAQWTIKDETDLAMKLEAIKGTKTKELYRLKTLTDLQKLLPKGSIDDLIIRKSSGVTMVKIDDKRPEISDIGNDFNDDATEEKENE